MKIFVVLTVVALLGGSNAFLEGLKDVFHNLGQELSGFGKDILHVAEPVANSVLQTLEKAGTQLLTASASELLSHLGAGATPAPGKRDLSNVVQKVEEFVTKGEKFIKDKASVMDGAFKYTLSKIEEEIQHVVNDVKPLSGLIDEVKGVITNHNNFLEELISKAEAEGMEIFNEIVHHGENKRGILETGQTFVQGIQHLLEEAKAPLQSALSGLLKNLEGQVLNLFG